MSSDYIRQRVDALRHNSEDIHSQAEGIFNNFDTWTALKLILHSAAVNMYTTVHAGQGTGDTFYIDALAGSGVSKYDSDRWFVGSPIVAARAAKEPFTKMYLIESNDEYCNALHDRLNYAFSIPGYTEPDELEIIEGDVNDEIMSVVDDIENTGNFNDRFNYYCFVDNQGLDVEWPSIEHLTPRPYGDLLINLPTAHGIGRNYDTEAAARFYGISSQELSSGQPTRADLHRRYCDQLRERGREVQTSTQVQTDIGSFYYDLVYATRETGGDNGYMDVIRYVKEFIESVHSGDVGRILDVLDTDQTPLGQFLPDESIEDELPDEDEDDDQRGLNEFR